MNSQLTQTGTKPKTRTAEGIYETLKSEILSGVYDSGELLSANELARKFGVSRMPIREALNRLAGDRLVKVLPQRGHIVRTISVTEAMEAFELREMLELKAIEEAVKRITDQEIETLRQIALSGEDPLLLNYRFHTKLAQISGNRLLAELIEEVLILMQRLLVDHIQVHMNDVEPELEIIEALKSRNAEIAKETMRNHIRDTYDNLFTHSNRDK